MAGSPMVIKAWSFIRTFLAGGFQIAKSLEVRNRKGFPTVLVYLITLCILFFLQTQAQIVETDPEWFTDVPSAYRIATFGGDNTSVQRTGLIYYDENNNDQFDRIADQLSKSFGPSSVYPQAHSTEGKITTWLFNR